MAKFKTRARAVEMLGRQQIAGVPTAISELFKNAHDAYADSAVVDYFASDGLFILRDDGLGMTLEDFEKRWLTIGTESKLKSTKGIPQPPIDPQKPLRPIMGEKGIGRLAIGVIGQQVLILTRAKRNDTLHDLVAAFLHWGLFAIPGLDLEQIDIPVRTFPGGSLPNFDDVQNLIGAVRQNVTALQSDGYIDKEDSDNIIEDLKKFKLNIQNMQQYLEGPSLLNGEHGTQFYVLPSREDIREDLAPTGVNPEESRIRKLLLGFNNTMTPDAKPPLLRTSFRFWRTDDSQPSDIMNDEAFFTPTEFLMADHVFQGHFDKAGQFIGTVSIYGGTPIRHVIPAPIKLRNSFECGPFEIKIAYIPGVQRDSKITPQDYAKLAKKVDAIGGLYIYKDNIRILPYGDNDFDFLDIEKRRSKGAGYYYFSYRRMFGTIELTREQNDRLREKAGREGFQDNRAFRDFRAVLINFLEQLAADFFREGGKKSEPYRETRNELNRLKTAREQQEKDSQKKRQQFEGSLERFFEKVSSGNVEQEASSVIQALLSDIERATQSQDEIALITAETQANRKLAEIRGHYRVERPDGIGLTPQLTRDWESYAAEMGRLDDEVFATVRAEVQQIVTQASAELRFALDKKQRIELLLNEIVIESRNSVQDEIKSTRETLGDIARRFDELNKQINAAMLQTSQSIENKLNQFDITEKTPEEIDAYRLILEKQVDEEAQRYISILKHIRAQIGSINWYQDENGLLIGYAEITAALEDEVLALRERVDADVELAQLGMALNIINHEFSNTIQAIRNGLRRLKTWANDNPPLMPVYAEISDSFTHLDGYLTLFTPLNRRLYRTKIEVTGNNIANYLQSLFQERLKRHNVTLEVTSSFRQMAVVGYPSTFYPVFVNLVDNAIFWLQNQSLPREIILDAQGDSFIVADNGSGVPARDQQAIFELGFTRKPGGRGMGLYISREVLKKEGYELVLLSQASEKGARFSLRPVSQISN